MGSKRALTYIPPKSDTANRPALVVGVDLRYNPLTINEMRDEMSLAGIKNLSPAEPSRINTRGIMDDETEEQRNKRFYRLSPIQDLLPYQDFAEIYDTRGPSTVPLKDPRNRRPTGKITPHCGDPTCDGVCMDMECWGQNPHGPAEMERRKPPEPPPDRIIDGDMKLLSPWWFVVWIGIIVGAFSYTHYFIK